MFLRGLHKALFAGLLLCTSPLMSASFAERLNEFDQYVRSSRDQWQVPGLAVGVVQRGEFVWLRGYGHTSVSRQQVITPSTLFPIGSLTKAMTAAVLVQLVNEGKLAWDAPVRTVMPGFRLSEAYASWDLRVRDLLTHSAGWAEHSGDLLLLSTSHPMMIRRAEAIKEATPFRSSFAYQNLLYLTAGQLIDAVTGNSWETEFQRRLFSPIGMSATHTHFTSLPLAAEVALPHVKVDDALSVVSWSEELDFGAAGSVVSNLNDLSYWLRYLLDSNPVSQTLLTPQVYLDKQPWLELLYPSSAWVSYGLGWFILEYEGAQLVDHSGNIPGITTKIALLPEHDLGIVILCNQEQSLLPHALMMRFVDDVLELPRRDWSSALLKVVASSDEFARIDREERKRLRLRNTQPSVQADALTGIYNDALMGSLLLSEQNGKLQATISGKLVADLRHWHHDTYELQWRSLMPKLYPGNVRLTFHRNDDAKVARVEVERMATFRR